MSSDYNIDQNYVTTEKELMSVVFPIGKFKPCLVGAKVFVCTDHVAPKYRSTKKGIKP